MKSSSLPQKILSPNKRPYSLFRRSFVKVVDAKKMPLKKDSQYSGIVQTFSAQPLVGETRLEFKLRVQKEVSAKLFTKTYANHELILCYPTRIAKSTERLDVACREAKHAEADLPTMNKLLFPGHCLLTFLNERGQPEFKHTISMRPDMQKPIVYHAVTAPDNRLPTMITRPMTTVRPARHTSTLQEINNWAEDAYYAFYVHPARPCYPLYCVLKPIPQSEQSSYFTAIDHLKLLYTNYSLLDHFHPDTGETDGTIVANQNCTVIIKLVELLMNMDVKKLLGDNPTPQLILETIKGLYFESEVEENDDFLSQRFERRASVGF